MHSDGACVRRRIGAAHFAARLLGAVACVAAVCSSAGVIASAAAEELSRKPIISCTGNEKNLATYLQMHQVLFTQRDGARVGEFYAPLIISHNLDSGGGGAREVRSAMLAEMWNTSRRVEPERVLEDELILCSGDFVIVRTMVRGRDNSGVPPYPPTGKPYATSATDIYRFKDGKVVERWGNSDLIGKYKQLGYTVTPSSAVTEKIEVGTNKKGETP